MTEEGAYNMAAVIAGIGTALPTGSIPTELFISHAKKFSCKTARQEKVLEELYRRTAIESRSSVLASYSYGKEGEGMFRPPLDEGDEGPGTASRMQCYAHEATPLAVSASMRALEDAQIAADAVTHVVTASCTGFAAPGFDIGIIERLGLPRNSSRTHVGFMGCHGAMNALRVANAYCLADPGAVILLCATELCSLHFQYGWSTDKLVANSLFSDGSAALVVVPQPMKRQPTSGTYRLIANTSFIVPDSADAMQWQIGDNGFRMQLSTRVPELVETALPEILNGWLSHFGYQANTISHWAIHPGGPRILDAAERCLQLSSDKMLPSRAVLSEYGNMSSPTVLFILERLKSQNAAGPCVVLGFGPGLTVEAILLEAEG